MRGYLKINWNNWNWNRQRTIHSSKKQNINKIRCQLSDCPRYVQPGKRDRMYKNPALIGIKRTCTPPLFPCFSLYFPHT